MLVKVLTISPQPVSELPRRGSPAQCADIVITVRPIGADKFEVRHAGRVLVASSATPFLDAARRLIAEGWAEGCVLAMRHKGASEIALRGRLGHVARFTIEEGDRPPTVRRWKPSPHAAVKPPMRFFRRGCLALPGAFASATALRRALPPNCGGGHDQRLYAYGPRI